MVTHMFYCEFITSFHEHYNGKFLKPNSWCHLPIEQEDDYIEITKRIVGGYFKISFLAKYDFNNKHILIKCKYNYVQCYNEKSEVHFSLKNYKDNTYNFKNIHGALVNPFADKEILTFIKMFDYFYLEEKDIPLSRDEYGMYMRHLDNYPELITENDSDICTYNVIFKYNDDEENILVKFFFHDKIDKSNDTMEYQMCKNRLLEDDSDYIDFEILDIIASKMDLIYMDFMQFVEFRLK